eukprot:TRINITY_DN3458_c0_g1_i1.p1 TRINITY_DN3458_c0_g1~~TRINITY_DN3458_c0_g1_i1.p1  ORF type:complete len:658 (-),score=155.48 TRINITY_DN3458_c0_g1_i1:71-2044(-)
MKPALFIFLSLLISLCFASLSKECFYDKHPACLDKSIKGPNPWMMKGGLRVGDKIFDAGVAFRVWAPNAPTAYVIPYNANGRWTQQAMTKDSSTGYFYVNVGNAQPGDSYFYQFQGTPSGTINRIDPRAQGIANATTNFQYSVVHDPNFSWTSNIVTVDQTKVVVYELHIPTFTSNGANPGTFDTAIAKLPYLKSLGINIIEPLPTATFCDQPNGWGYNPCAPYATMNAFGGYQALKRFINAANQIGIGVILDVVWNHMDSNNALISFDGYNGTTGNGIYFYDTSQDANTDWGPRPNFGNSEVSSYILDSITMWIQEYHVSGFRWDSTVCIRKGTPTCWGSGANNIDHGWELLQNANNLVQKLLPGGFFTTAEDDQGLPTITLPTTDLNVGQGNVKGGAGFTSQWGYPFFYNFFAQLTQADNSNINAGDISNLITDENDLGGDPRRVLFTENHDMASNQNKGRIPNVIDPGGNAYKPAYWAQKKSMLGIATVLTTSLYPMLFYGQEMLSYTTFDFPVPPVLDWGLVTANAGMVQETSDLIALRTNTGGHGNGLSGNFTQILSVSNDATDKVVAFRRSTSSSDPGMIVVLNFYQTNYPSFILQNMPKDGKWNVVFNGDLTKYSSQYGNYGSSQTYVTVSGGQGSLVLPQASAVILSMD